MASGTSGTGIKLLGWNAGAGPSSSGGIVYPSVPGSSEPETGFREASRHAFTSSARLRLGGLNLEHKLLSAPLNMALDAGFALQDLYSEQASSRTGLSFSLNGQIGFDNGITLFGRSTWLHELSNPGSLDAIPELEFTTGVILRPQPNFSIQAGYRRFNLEQGDQRSAASPYLMQGLFLGTGLYW